jgi:hypothetical protein
VTVSASCDRHPILSVVATQSSIAQVEVPAPARPVGLGEEPGLPRAGPDDHAALPPHAQAIPMRAVVDDYPAWSPDGRWIAFHRRYPSRYGPAGLYLVSRYGGEPRWLMPGNLVYPRELSFSADGRRLVCSYNGQLAFVDLATGMVSAPMYTDNGVAHPDWSPDGRSIVYARRFLRGFPPEPPDSAGLHLFDVSSGIDRPLRHGDTVLPSGPVRWIRNGRALVVIHGTTSGDQLLSVATLDGREFATIHSVSVPKLLWSLQHLRPARPAVGPLATESLVMLVIGRAIERTLQVTIDPFVISDRPLLGLWDALSPTGREVVVVRPDPADSLGVLYVGQANGPPQARMLQLTRYEPP